MTIRVRCVCGKKLPIKDEYAGRRIECPECQKSISVPKANETSPDDERDMPSPPAKAKPVKKRKPAVKECLEVDSYETDNAADLADQFDRNDDFKPTRRARRPNKKRDWKKKGLERLRSFAGWLLASPFVLLIVGCVSACILCALFTTTTTSICLVLACVGGATLILGNIWMIVATFRVSVGLGIFFILIGLINSSVVAASHPGPGVIVTLACFLIRIVLIIENWHEFRRSVLYQVSGFLMLAIGLTVPLYPLFSRAHDIAQERRRSIDSAPQDVDAAPPMMTLQRHTGPVLHVAFSADGRRLASASMDQTVKVWDAASGNEMLTLKGHNHTVTSVAFSPDGDRLVSASMDKTIRLWDATTGVETLTLKGHLSGVWSVAFSPNGKQLASASVADEKQVASRVLGANLRTWDATSGEMALVLNDVSNSKIDFHNYTSTHVNFSPDGTRLASASQTKTVKVWDAISGQETLKLQGHTMSVSSVAFSPDGKRLASASGDRTVKVWDAMDGHEILILSGHSDGVTSVAFSPDSRRMASASRDKTVKVWDSVSGQETLRLSGHTGAVHCVAFSPDGKRLASAGQDSTVKVWDAEPRR